MRDMTKRTVILVAAVVVGLGLGACTAGSPADRSAAMVLDNAGSVVRTGADKLWEAPQPTPTANPQ